MRSFSDNVYPKIRFSELEPEVRLELVLDLERKLKFGSKLGLDLAPEPELHFRQALEGRA